MVRIIHAMHVKYMLCHGTYDTLYDCLIVFVVVPLCVSCILWCV